MKKRILSLLIVLCLVCGMIPAVSAAKLDNGLKYEVYEDHVEITGYTGSATELVIPATIEKLPVTAIADFAFEYCPNLTSVTIPNGVTSIGNSAFLLCSKLTHISIPKSVTSIGAGAFFSCTRLTNITIPTGVRTIGECAFTYCTKLTEIYIPDSVTHIGNQAFMYCSSLNRIEVSKYNRSYSNDDRGILFNKEKTHLIHAPSSVKGSYIIPNSVNSIGEYAFFQCSGMTRVTIPSSVSSIADCAFYDCTNLTSICFMGDAPVLGEHIFWDVAATAYHPAGNSTWTADVMQNYDGDIAWTAYIPTHFTDAAVDSFYYEPILWALENNITSGTSATTFSPGDDCMRAYVVTFLWRAAGCPEPKSSANPFVDVAPGSFYEKPVLWAVENGITTGADATHFNPSGVCNRAQTVTFLYRAFGSPAVNTNDLPFSDVPADSWCAAPVAWAVKNDITNGLSATSFGPETSCNRAQVVTFLYRAYN